MGDVCFRLACDEKSKGMEYEEGPGNGTKQPGLGIQIGTFIKAIDDNEAGREKQGVR